MEEFFLKNYSLLTHSVEALAALTGVILFKKFKSSYAKYFIYFLIYVAVFDSIGTYTHYVYPGAPLEFFIGTIFEKNHWIYTIFWGIGAILFYSFYYFKILVTKSFKKIIRYASTIFLIVSVGHILLNRHAFFSTFFPIISVLGAFVILSCTVFYFLETLLSDKILTFYKSINFYISSAIFIWWLIITPIVFYDNYARYEATVYERDWNYIRLKHLIYLFSNIFMYLTFTFAFIRCKPEND